MVERIMWKRIIILGICLLIPLAVSCGQNVPPTPTIAPLAPLVPRTPTPTPASDEEALEMLLNAEKEGVVQQDIDRLEEIWDPQGAIIDANHTPNDESDDIVWRGWVEIRDRYVNLVFPSAPVEAQAMDLDIQIEGDTATVMSTTQIGGETSPGGDKWTFEKKDGAWRIMSLTYNLEE